MRDPARITPFLEEIAKVWRLNPDLRFGQMLGNFFDQEILTIDPFFFEEVEFLERFKIYYDWNKEDIDDN